jgi:putative PIG3 family NAD(P)H quinone oxidoreductase
MRVVVVSKPGGPEVLELRQVPVPEPPPEHVRVRVKFAGVNRVDLLQRQGLYPAPPGAPADVPGLEYAGFVDAIGDGVTQFVVGDRVFGLVGGGAYGEFVVVHEREAVGVPESISDEEAAAVPEAFVTAYDALVVRGRLQPGERVLVNAAGSGVGTAGVQLAHALGCTVIGTSRKKEKLDRARELGLDIAIVPDGSAFADRILAETNGAGADVVLELVGGAYFEEDFRVCATRGRIVVVGVTAGASSEINLGLLLRKRLEIVGTSLRSRPIEEKIEAARMLERPIVTWLVRGVVRPVIDRVFSLGEAGAAHERVASDETFGKVLLAIDR